MSAQAQPDARYLLRELLRDVSRSFYLTLRVLPGAIRPQIGLAYLLARATDTIADTPAVPVERRLTALRALRDQIAGNGTGDFLISEIKAEQATAAEQTLLAKIHDLLRLLGSFHPEDRKLIQKVLEVITSGQELDLLRFGEKTGIKALSTDEELEDYTYRVAGCVGEFWTLICLRHLSPVPRADEADLVQRGVRFGKGLQLINILRDIPADLRNGRCYLPTKALQAEGLSPDDLLNPANEPQTRPVYDLWLNRAEEHLAVGWTYVQDLPRRWLRVRLACAWPILIGFATAAKLKRENVLNPDSRIKVSRAEIKRIIRRSVLLYPFPGPWNALPKHVGIPR